MVDMTRKITDARSSDVRPFVDNIGSVDSLYNEPTMLAADEEAMYVLPVSNNGAAIGQPVA